MGLWSEPWLTFGLFGPSPMNIPADIFNPLFHFYFVFLLYHSFSVVSSFFRIVEVLILENSQRKPEKKICWNSILSFALSFVLPFALWEKSPSEILTSFSINYFPSQVYLMRVMIFFHSLTNICTYLECYVLPRCLKMSHYVKKKRKEK